MTLLEDVVDHIEHFQRRVVQDALAEATASYWLRRAAQFESALPRPNDSPGESTEDDKNARRSHLTAIAAACRRRAAISLIERTPS